jgi:hypothetical protein
LLLLFLGDFGFPILFGVDHGVCVLVVWVRVGLVCRSHHV